MGETRVDLLHLLEDLRDAYPGAIEETILTEIVANSLDSGAARIRLTTAPEQRTVTAVDDGSGMLRRELARYHDVAASAKVRGQGIGFAGVGIKLGLLVCEEVWTETRRGKTHVASLWHLASRHRAPWKWVPPPGHVVERGTAVSLRLRNPLSPLLDPGYLESTLRRHYQPLFDPGFDSILAAHYPRGIRFEVNGSPIDRHAPRAAETAPIAIRLARKRKPSAVGYLLRVAEPLPDPRRGVAVTTLGKVIKQGWDWLGIAPAAPERIWGIIEAPALADCLTLNKADFIRAGARGGTYLAYRKVMQEAVTEALGTWGDLRDPAEETRRRAARPLERDLERVLIGMADDFPLLSAIVDRRPGGQRRLPMGRPGSVGEDLGALVPAGGGGSEGASPDGGAESDAEGAAPDSAEARTTETATQVAESTSEHEPRLDGSALPGSQGRKQASRYRLSIRFEERPDDPEPGRLIESAVHVNVSHPAYRRAAASRAEGYHVAVAVALSIAPLAVEPAEEHAFVTAFLARWGEALRPRG